MIDTDTSYNLLLGQTWIHANWIVPSTLHQCFKYVDDKAMVRTVFAETQLFKGVKDYFTDSLLYREVNKVVKEPLPDDINSDNETNFESKDDMPATFVMELIVPYFNDPDCNDFAKMMVNGSSMEILLLIILCVLMTYLILLSLASCTCSCLQQEWHACG